MSSPMLWEQLESSPVATHIGETWWFPLLESVHVLAAVFMVGSLLMVDLRLMNAAALRYSLERLTDELTPWTWTAFAITTLTGAGLFITRASSYIANVAMQAKLVLLVLAGVNMLMLHLLTLRRAPREVAHGAAKKFAGAASLAIWIGVMLSGRWIGHLS